MCKLRKGFLFIVTNIFVLKLGISKKKKKKKKKKDYRLLEYFLVNWVTNLIINLESLN